MMNIPFCVVCPDVRAYTTHFSPEDCVSLLSRKNVYDCFEYEFAQDGGANTITFGAPLIPRELSLRFCLGIVFSIEFERQSNRTRFVIRFLRVENRPELGAHMSMEHLDQFFRIKLNAKPWYPEI